MSGLQKGIRLQPAPKILVKESIVRSLHSKLLPNGKNSATITQGMHNCLCLQLTEGASSINKDTSSSQTLLHPNNVVHASPYEYMNSRQSVKAPNPCT